MRQTIRRVFLKSKVNGRLNSGKHIKSTAKRRVTMTYDLMTPWNNTSEIAMRHPSIRYSAKQDMSGSSARLLCNFLRTARAGDNLTRRTSSSSEGFNSDSCPRTIASSRHHYPTGLNLLRAIWLRNNKKIDFGGRKIDHHATTKL